MAKEYIERDAAIDRLNENWRRTNTGSIAEACYSASIDSIHLIPAADVVEVVRCRDCKHYNAGFECLIEGYGIERPADYFCADGKRKDGGQDDGN